MRDLAKEFISISLDDIKASQILYSNKLYPQSVFYFQQASEKANKAFGLIAKLITEEELLKIGHVSLKIQRKALAQHEKNIIELLEAYERNPAIETLPPFKKLNIKEHHKKIKDGLKIFDKLFNPDFKNLPLSDLKHLLTELNELWDLNIKIPKKGMKESIRKDMKEYADGLYSMGKMTSEDYTKAYIELNDDILLNKIVYGLTKGMEKTLRNMRLYPAIQVCALITMKHVSTSRYPDIRTTPLKLYNKKNPLVRLQPEFIVLLKKALIQLRRID